jgi:hypothetical protein
MNQDNPWASIPLGDGLWLIVDHRFDSLCYANAIPEVWNNPKGLGITTNGERERGFAIALHRKLVVRVGRDSYTVTKLARSWVRLLQ